MTFTTICEVLLQRFGDSDIITSTFIITDCNIAILILKNFICDDLATLCVNLVNFGPVTPEFKRVVGVHPSFQNNKSFEANHLRIYLTDVTKFSPYGRYLIVD